MHINPIRIAVLLTAVFQSSTAYSQVLFSDGFESGDLSATQNSVKWGGRRDTAVKTTNPRTGSYSLEFDYGPVVDNKDSFSEQRFSLGGNYPEVWIKYDLYIPANYYHRTQTGTANNKSFVHLWGDKYDRTSDGIGAGFEIWPSGDGFGKLAFHQFRPAMSHMTDLKRTSRGIDPEDLGKWMQLVIQIKAGTIGSTEYARGARVNVWKTPQNGTAKLIYSLEPSSTFPAWIENVENALFRPEGKNYFNTGYLLGWANSGFIVRTKLYIDNVVIATTPLISLDPPVAPVANQ